MVAVSASVWVIHLVQVLLLGADDVLQMSVVPSVRDVGGVCKTVYVFDSDQGGRCGV